MGMTLTYATTLTQVQAKAMAKRARVESYGQDGTGFTFQVLDRGTRAEPRFVKLLWPPKRFGSDRVECWGIDR